MDWKAHRKVLEGEPSDEEIQRIVTEIREHHRVLQETTQDYSYLRTDDFRAVVRKLCSLIFGDD
ncbi:hypothetical protein [Vibrio phage PJN101]|nr:hypothetical protein [Vibrio phage PJN101]